MQAKPGRWLWALVAASAIVSIALLATALEKQPSEGKIAMVNGSVITRADLDREVSRVRQRLVSMGKSLSDSQLREVEKKILESLINRDLLYQESKAKGIQVEGAALNKQLKRLKENFPSEEEFKNALIVMNLSEAGIKSQIERDLTVQKFIDIQFNEKITVSGKESKAYYDSNKDSFRQPEQVHARHILIKVDFQDDNSQKAVARKKIEEIQKKVRKGEDFASLAKAFSQCPSSTKGGDLGYFSRGQMVEPFGEAAFVLKPGEVSSIIETRFGYHLIKAIDKKPETIMSYEEIKDKIQQYKKQQKVQEQLNQYIEELKGKAKVERFLTENPQ